MYLKNTSKSVSIVINTARGKVGIRPEEIVDIKYKILPPVSTALKEVSEEEYLCFCEGTKGVVETIIENEDKNIQQDREVVKEDTLEGMDRISDVPVEEEQEETEKNDGILGFVNSLIGEKENSALVVKETNSVSETEQLTQQIKDLKISWKETKSPKKKEKLTKEIKELQKQLDRIKG